MTENRRIFWNIVATYGRSMYSLVLGLCCGRWTLAALGKVDYGLNGLIAGLTGFITFVNGLLSAATSRFYTFSIGEANAAADKEAALEECRRWFNTAITIHWAIPLVSAAVCYPLGAYAIEHWLTIPPDRVAACIWVFRFVCIQCVVGMLNVPFNAMYTAKQYIAELTIYSFVTATLNAGVVYYMMMHPGDWLAKFAGWTCFLSVVPQIIIGIRACIIFPECRLNVRYMGDWSRVRQIGAFSGWVFFGRVCGLMNNEGMSVAINKFFGPVMNAANAIGLSVDGHCHTLAGAMHGAFAPVITQACGAGDYAKMNKFALRSSKFNIVMSAIFMIPLALELPEVMVLWLKNPPEYAAGLCLCAMLKYIACYCSLGYLVAILATGKIGLYHVVMGVMAIVNLPLAIGAGFIWRSVYVMMGIGIVLECINTVGRMLFARHLCGSSIRDWLNQVIIPIGLVVAGCSAVGYLPHLFMVSSFSRVCATTLLCEIVYLPLVWFLLFSVEEREFVNEKIFCRVKRAFVR